MNTTPTNNPKIALEDIIQRKDDLKKEIDAQNKIIIKSVRNIFAPEPATSSANSLMKSFNTGLAIYDGVMTGIKIMRKIRVFLRRMK